MAFSAKNREFESIGPIPTIYETSSKSERLNLYKTERFVALEGTGMKFPSVTHAVFCASADQTREYRNRIYFATLPVFGLFTLERERLFWTPYKTA